MQNLSVPLSLQSNLFPGFKFYVKLSTEVKPSYPGKAGDFRKEEKS
jgi:hypothetical protein